MNIKFLAEEGEKTKNNPAVAIQNQENSELRSYIINYVGERKAKKEEVTVEMIAETLAEEFPEFLLAVAEENWVRGYQQALTDVSVGEKLAQQESEIAESADLSQNEL